MKRFIQLPVLLLAILMLFSACSGSSSTSDTTTANPVTTAAPETEAPSTDLKIVENGVANYRIVRGEKATKGMINAASRLRDLIGTYTGVYPDLSTDWNRNISDLDHSTLEILVGRTDYSESAAALEGVPYGDYIFTRIDNKIILNAWCDAGMEAAVTALGRYLLTNTETGSFSLPADVRMTGTQLEIVNALPHYPGGEVRTIYHAGNDNQLLIIDKTNPEEYAAYCKTLAASGYTLYTENAITDNKFATYINDKYVINAGYYAYETAARIIIEPRTTLPELASANQYESKVQPSFALLGLEFPIDGILMQNGLCIIFQLSDGSFIVIDGGFPHMRDADAIYQYLYEHAPDKNNITIAGWFITHAHSDHYAAYNLFSQTYANKVKVEYVIGNFPSDEARAEGGLGTEGSVGKQVEQNVARFEGAKFIKAHTGYQFFMRDAKIEILYTLESFAPGILSYFNTSSMIFTVEIAGQKFNILGDASNDSCLIADKMYGDYLKADFVQTAHHGYTTGSTSTGGVTAVYKKSAAPFVVWPIGEIDYGTMSEHYPWSAYLQELDTTKEIFVAGSRVTRLLLPYTLGTSGMETILK